MISIAQANQLYEYFEQKKIKINGRWAFQHTICNLQHKKYKIHLLSYPQNAFDSKEYDIIFNVKSAGPKSLASRTNSKNNKENKPYTVEINYQ